MRSLHSTSIWHRVWYGAAALLAGGILSACNGGSNVLGPLSPGSSNAQVRFVNGSPDAGNVQVFIDNQQQFCSTGTTGAACSVDYGTVTGYAVNLKVGSHAMVIRDSSGNSLTVPSSTLSVNSGFKYSVVLAGEVHPSASGSPLGIVTIQQQPFNTPGGGAALNFNNGSPAATKSLGGSVQFGYILNSGGGTGVPTSVGSPIGVGTETNPSNGGLPQSALNIPLTLFAGTGTSRITATPSQINPANCSSNALPCANNSQNLSIYLIDGPAASTTPSAGPYPSGATSTSLGVMVGAFDSNG